MGILRLLLAISVLFAHTAMSGSLTGGDVAVQAFYIISGFYMALILDTTYHEARLFYTNRLLRLMPAYWTIALLTLAGYLVVDPGFFRAFAALPGSAQAFLAFTNVVLYFQDWTMFLATDGRSLHFTGDFMASTPPLFRFLLVPQAWTLGLELSFYLLAPMLLGLRSRWLVAIALASLAFRALLWRAGLRDDPWTYRFFPFELALFLAGSLAYRAYRRHRPAIARMPRWVPRAATAAIWAFVLAFPAVPLERPIRAVAFYGLLLALLPLVFHASRESRWDRALGELSYPTYLVHLLVIGAVSVVFRGEPALTSGTGGALFACAATLAVAFAIHRVVEVPVERLRERRKRRGAPAGAYGSEASNPILSRTT